MRHTVEVDGRILPVANIVRRGAALAVDLCIAVFLGSLVFYAVSTRVPLDSEAARIPVLLVVAAAVGYLIWARDHVLPSYGRKIFRLILVRPGGGSVPARLSRPVTAYDQTDTREDYTRAAVAVVVVAATSLLALVVLGHGLSTTTVYRTALAFTAAAAPFAGQFGAPPRLGAYPRALLVGKERAYVQADATWGAPGAGGSRALEFFLRRGAHGWEVAEVKAVEPSMFGRFALAVADEEVPVP